MAQPRGVMRIWLTVFMLHVVDSVNAMHRTIGVDAPDVSRAAVEAAVKATLQAGMQAFHQTHGRVPQEEYKVTVLICDQPKDAKAKADEEADSEALLPETDVYCHVAVLPSAPQRAVPSPSQGAAAPQRRRQRLGVGPRPQGHLRRTAGRCGGDRADGSRDAGARGRLADQLLRD